MGLFGPNYFYAIILFSILSSLGVKKTFYISLLLKIRLKVFDFLNNIYTITLLHDRSMLHTCQIII